MPAFHDHAVNVSSPGAVDGQDTRVLGKFLRGVAKLNADQRNLTGRHGLFNSYEAFIRIVDSMFSQHAKWLKVTAEPPWHRKIASLNYLLASPVWQQDRNGPWARPSR